jgi:hypothetical protein
MPIQVTCSGCKATFTVSDKFAGKTGPCPKCKTVITIPKPQAEVTIHAPTPDTPTTKVSQAGRNLTPKPIRRQETSVTVPRIVTVLVIVIVAIVAAWFGGPFLRENETAALAARVVGLLLIGVPIAMGTYAILRDDELEPFRGRSLILRSLVCATAYTALWVVFHFIPPDATRTIYNYVIVGPPFFLVGAGIALACFDLDYGTGFFHYCSYVLLTLALGYIAGLPMPWVGVKI